MCQQKNNKKKEGEAVDEERSDMSFQSDVKPSPHRLQRPHTGIDATTTADYDLNIHGTH